ncbi:hypothetical protein ACFLU4_01805 [Chloroflexota bacterium]
MGDEYKKIEKVGDEILEWYKGILSKERLLYSEMIELSLESIRPLAGYRKDTIYDELSLLTLFTRLFNDVEGAKDLLLRGLPDQANIVIRDIIECTMLFRLFLKNSEIAERWLMKLKEYQLGDVNTKLIEIGVKAREYAFYGMLSHEGHSNLLASISSVQEEEVKEGMLRTFHCGSSRTPETVFFVQHGFLMLFFLLYISLVEPLAECYSQHSDASSFSIWAEKVNSMSLKFVELAREYAKKSIAEKAQFDTGLYKLTEKKMRWKEVKIWLSSSGDKSDE